jgi:septal ring factor EnvC (AmiA/AmiB activator)
MKGIWMQLVVLLAVVIVIAAYAQYNTMEQTITRKAMETMSFNLEQLTMMLRQKDNRYERYTRTIEDLETRLARTEKERAQLLSRVDMLASQVSAMSASLQARQVDLPTIAVTKKGR